jgi:uncharacterized membrane protein
MDSVVDLKLIIGLVGSLIVLVAYVLNQLHFWKANDFEYDFINLVGSVFLSIYAYMIGSWPILFLFVVWVIFSLRDCLIDFAHRFDWKRRKKKT